MDPTYVAGITLRYSGDMANAVSQRLRGGVVYIGGEGGA
jgi:hypothetical protein